MTLQAQLQEKKVIIFDLDGTLVKLAVDWDDLKQLLNNRYSQLYEDAGCQFDSISRCLSFIVEKDDEEELHNFFKIIRNHELAGVPASEPIEEAVYFIKNREEFGVNSEVKLAILSLNTRSCIQNALELAEIDKEIDYIVGREDVRKWKPHPQGLLKIQKHYGIKKEEIIYIGDMVKDLNTGKKAGIESHLIEELIAMVREHHNG